MFMKKTLREWEDVIRQYIWDSPSLQWVWFELGNRKDEIDFILSLDAPEEDTLSERSCIYLMSDTITPDIIVMLAHELKHAHTDHGYSDLSNERISYAFQVMVREELRSKGYEITDASEPLSDEEILEAHGEEQAGESLTEILSRCVPITRYQ